MGVPLAVEIVCHVDDVVNDIADILYWKLLQVPVRGRGGNGDCLSGKQVLQDGKEGQIFGAILGLAGVKVGEVWRAWIFLVNIDTVKIMLLDEIGDVGGYL